MDVKSDAVGDISRDLGLLDGDGSADFGDLARTLSHRWHLELATGDRRECGADTFFGHGHLEEAPPEGFVTDVLEPCMSKYRLTSAPATTTDRAVSAAPASQAVRQTPSRGTPVPMSTQLFSVAIGQPAAMVT